jgi:hypothetical protein
MRRSPLFVVIVAAQSLAIAVIALLFILGRSRHGTEERREEVAPVFDADGMRHEPTPSPGSGSTSGSRSATAAVDASAAPAEAPGAVPAAQDADPEQLPIWARPPRIMSTPFPEGGRYNPPLPPVKLLPEMLDPPQTGAALPDREQL